MSKLIDTGKYEFYTDAAGRRVLRKKERDGRFHPTIGRYTLINSDGTVAEQGDWVENLLAQQGELSILNVYFLNTAQLATLYLALLTATPTATTTMATMTEVFAPPLNGYARVAVNAADWGAPALDSNDYMTTAASKTFGPASSNPWNSMTYVAVVTTATGTAGQFIGAVALSGATTVSVGQSLTYQIAMKAKSS